MAAASPMPPLSLSRLGAVVAAFTLAGCAGVLPQAAFDEVEQTVVQRTGLAPEAVVWRTDSEADRAADDAVTALLADSLTAEAAVQVALLNNRRLQATYEDLGVAQAALVQAGLLRNPVFGARARWGLDEAGPPDLGFAVALPFLDVFRIPLRRAVAQTEFEAARLRVTEAVLDLAAETHVAFVRAQADAARLALQQRVVANAEAGYAASVALREAGNVPAADVLAEQALYEQARLDAVLAEAAAVESREALARRMGLFGPEAAFALPTTLPPLAPPASVQTVGGDALAAAPAIDVAALERGAVEASLPLAAARLDVEAAARRLGLTDAEALLPNLDVGGELERDDGKWEAGPEVEVVLPLFDQGQARHTAARSDLRRAQATYYATAVDVRSAARVLAARVAARYRTALHYQTVVLPLRSQLVQQTLRQYNAMQTGVFGLLQAQAQEVEAARAATSALADYHAARIDLDALRQGRMPALGAAPAASGPSPTMRTDDDH